MTEALIEKITDIIDGHLKDDFDARSIFHRKIVREAVVLAMPLFPASETNAMPSTEDDIRADAILKAFEPLSKLGKPECPYCGATEGLRMLHDGGGYIAPEYTCEDCFTGQDDGPCFDDLPEVES